MARSIQEIVNEIQNINFASSSGPLLELCRELSSDGRFEELADSVAVWLTKYPKSSDFIRARMPALILNSYLVNQDILDFNEFLDWEATCNWSEEIKKNADKSLKLPSTIKSITDSMHSYKHGNA